MRVTVPSSASKMMAHLCSVGVPIWRSRQLAEALSWPSANHWKNGAFDASSVRVKGRLHCRWLRAWRAQKPSISWSASAHTPPYPDMPDTRAALTMASDGGNTRFSISTDSMADVGALMVMVSWVQRKLAGTVGPGSYRPLTQLTDNAGALERGGRNRIMRTACDI